MPRPRKPANAFRHFHSSPEVIRLVVHLYVRFPLSLRNVEDLLFERGIDLCHETVRLWWNRFGPMFAADIRRQRVSRMRGFRHWKWHLDEVYIKINGETHYLWRAVDHEGEVLESYVTRTRDKPAASRFMKKVLKCHGSPGTIVTDGLKSYPAAMRELGNLELREMGRHLNNRAENSHLGSVRPVWHRQQVTASGGNGSQIEGKAAQSVPVLQLVTRGDPPCGSHVCPISAELAECGRSPVRARHRDLP